MIEPFEMTNDVEIEAWADGYQCNVGCFALAKGQEIELEFYDEDTDDIKNIIVDGVKHADWGISKGEQELLNSTQPIDHLSPTNPISWEEAQQVYRDKFR